MQYNWQQKNWTEFKYGLQAIEDNIFAFVEEIGRMSGLLKWMPEDAQTEAIVNMMVSETIKTSEIEGEYLSR